MTLETLRRMTAEWDALAIEWPTLSEAERSAIRARYAATVSDEQSTRADISTARFILGAIDLYEGDGRDG
jgi:hypothetical protein